MDKFGSGHLFVLVGQLLNILPIWKQSQDQQEVGLHCPIWKPKGGPAIVPCIGRWILNHWTTREVPSYWSFLAAVVCWSQLVPAHESLL